MDLELFCDDGAFRERKKTRRVIRNTYESEAGPKIERRHVYFQNGVYWACNGDVSIPLDPLKGGRTGSYCPRRES